MTAWNARCICGNASDSRAPGAAAQQAVGQALKLRIPPAHAVRGSRATTGSRTPWGLVCASRLRRDRIGLCASLPSLTEDKTSLCPPLARPWVVAVALPALFNSPESHNMEKTARSFIYQPTKSFPVNGLRTYSATNEANPRNPMSLGSYTLCEVSGKIGKICPSGTTFFAAR